VYDASALLDFPDSTGPAFLLPRVPTAPPRCRATTLSSVAQAGSSGPVACAISSGCGWSLAQGSRRSTDWIPLLLALYLSPSLLPFYPHRVTEPTRVYAMRRSGAFSDHAGGRCVRRLLLSLATPREDRTTTTVATVDVSSATRAYPRRRRRRSYRGVVWQRHGGHANDEREIDRPLAPDGRRSYVSTVRLPPSVAQWRRTAAVQG